MKDNKFFDKKTIIIIAIAALILIVGYLIFIKDSSNKNNNDYNNDNNNHYENDPIDIINITLNTDNIELNIGQTYTLGVKIDPINATDKTLVWKSSNPNVATVDSKGKVKSLAPGSTTITATSAKNKITDSCNVTVINNNVEVSSISLPTNTIALTAGDKYQIMAIVNPSNATNKNLFYTTTNDQIATVNNSGEITAIKAGNVNIIITANNNMTATLNLTVVAKVSSIVPSCPSSLYYLNSSKTTCTQYLYYSACPSGYTYDNSINKCKINRTPACSYPATILPNGDCSLKSTSNPICTTGIYDSVTKKCIKDSTPTCSSGVFSSFDNKCIYGTSSCTSGASYDPITRKCYYDQPATCPNGYSMQNGVCKNSYNQTITAVCPNSAFMNFILIDSDTCRLNTQPSCSTGTFNPNNGICETGGYTSIRCLSGSYNYTTKTCRTYNSFTCTTGYTANIVTGICQHTNITASCPSDYVYNSSIKKCVKSINTSCSSINHTVNSSGYCTGTNTLTPSCPNGYTYSNGTCLEN